MTTALQDPPEYGIDPETARSLPHSIGAEKSILSSMLKDSERWIGRAQETGLTREHFYMPGHGVLFETIAGLQSEGKPIELVSLVQLLHDRGKLDHIGGSAGVTDIYTYAPNAAHFEVHLNLVRAKYLLRSGITTCTAAVAEAYDNPEEPEAWLDALESAVLSIRSEGETREIASTKDLLRQVMTHTRETIEGKDDQRSIPTGFPELDRMAKGLRPGEMFVVAARPSMGKTSLMMNIVEHVAVDQGVPTLVFSVEMTAFQLMERLVFARSRFPASNLRKGFRPDKATLQRLKRAAQEIEASTLLVDDTPGLQIDALRAKARRRKREDGIGLITIDYLQLLRSTSRQAANSREREIGEISAGVKGLAKELDVPVLVLAQLNRGPEARQGGKPRMSDLRESGTIEQDADLIGLLYRSAYYAETQEQRDESAGEAELVLAKNRHGETGLVPLTFLDQLMRFEARAVHP